MDLAEGVGIQWPCGEPEINRQQDEQAMTGNSTGERYIELTASIVSAYVSNNTVAANDLPALIDQVHTALARVSGGQADMTSEPLRPAIALKKSVTAEHIVCLEDGKNLKSLKRHV